MPPFGPYKDFTACVVDQTGKGHSDAAAHRICGALQAELEKSARVAVVGGPRVGKTTFAKSLSKKSGAPVVHTDDLISLGWSAASDEVAKKLDADGPWIIEGVAAARGLRKWLAAHPGERAPVDVVYVGKKARGERTSRQDAMAAGVDKVWDEIRELLEEGGAAVLDLDEEDGVDQRAIMNESGKPAPLPSPGMPVPASAATDVEEFSAKPGQTRAGDEPEQRPKLGAALSFVDRYSRSVSIVASTTNPAGDQPAITSWRLERFLKAPVILWAHRSEEMPIGTATDVEFGPEGLKMRVHFASAKANPFAEEIWNAVLEGVVRSCSVGYELVGPNEANLLEVSMVPVGLDEDAGDALLNPDAELTDDEKLAASASKAASELARHRARVRRKIREESRTDYAGGEGVSFRADVARLGKAKRNQIGGVEVDARLTRTGVLEYHLPDGSVRREYRPESEVFKEDSLATLRYVPVIDFRDHSGMVTPETWKRSALGLVTSVRRDGRYVAGGLHVNDAGAIDRIDRGERADVSCGYTCVLDMTPGTSPDGETYDCVQRNIRYNHVALCPPNGGRAGPEVGLRLDQKNAPHWGVSNERNEDMTIKVRLDGREYDEGSREHLAKLEDMHKLDVEKVRSDAKDALTAAEAKVTEVTKRADAAEGRADAAEKALDAERADAKRSKERAAEEFAEKEKGMRAAFARKLRLVRAFVRWFSSDDGEDGKGKDGKGDGSEDEKMDARDAQLLDMSERDLMLESIKRVDPKFDAKDPDGNDRSDDYVRAVYDSSVKQARRARGVNGVVDVVESLRRADSADDAGMADARKKRDEWARNAHKNGGAR